MGTIELLLEDPQWMLLLFTLPIVIWLRSRAPSHVLIVPFSSSWHRPSKRWALVPETIAFLTAFCLLIFAIARPQIADRQIHERFLGYDIMLCIDLSRSMLAEDYQHNGTSISRFGALKQFLDEFVKHREHDRIGVIVFSGSACTLAPLTSNLTWIRRQLDRMPVGLLGDGTAIGDGLGLALTRLTAGRAAVPAKTGGAFVVLVSDGANNAGILEPKEATALANARGIPVFTVAFGSPGYIEIPRITAEGKKEYDSAISEVDPVVLWRIATNTGGAFFNAQDEKEAAHAFRAIDRIKKTPQEIRVEVSKTELYPYFVVLAIAAGAVTIKRRPLQCLNG